MEILAPDVYVNASVALGSAPEKVAQRFLGGDRHNSKTTPFQSLFVHICLSHNVMAHYAIFFFILPIKVSSSCDLRSSSKATASAPAR